MQEQQKDLREFLKLTRPEWCMIKASGKTDVHWAMLKLKDIGVTDINELMRRVRACTLNMDLSQAGHTRFGEDTIEALRSEASFVRALEYLKEPHYRQTGTFAPVPVLLAKTYTPQWGGQKYNKAPSGSLKLTSSWGSHRHSHVAGAWLLTEGPGDSCMLGASIGNDDDDRPHTAPSLGAFRMSPQASGAFDDDRPHTAPELSFRCSPTASSKAASPQVPAQRHGSVGICGSSQRLSSTPQGATQRSSSAPQRMRPSSMTSSEDGTIQERPRLRFRHHTAATVGMARAAAAAAEEEKDGSRRPRSAASQASILKALSTTQMLRQALRTGKDGNSSSRTSSLEAAADDDDPVEFASASLDMSIRPAPTLEMDVERLHQAAQSMRTRPRIASWRPAAAEGLAAEQAGITPAWEEVPGESIVLSRAADQVLKETQAMEEKDYMFLQMRREGPHSATRRVISSNVRSRMRGAALSDGKKAADVHVRSTRIRKNLAEMKSSRQELRSSRRNLEAALLPPKPKKEPRFDREFLAARSTLSAQAVA